MANEAIWRDNLGETPIDFTVADGTGIEKGALCKLTDPRTAALSDTLGEPIAGIAAREKIANNTITRLAFHRKGIFDMVASGAITVGEPVTTAADANYPNTVRVALESAISGAAVIGHSLETASDGEVVQILFNIGSGSPQK